MGKWIRVVSCLLGLILSGAIAQAGVITLDATSRGWLNSSGGSDAAGEYANYFVGWCPDNCTTGEYRDFFRFDVPALDGSVVAARLLLDTAVVVTPDPSETYQVTSLPATFGFSDLGSGTFYGSRIYTTGDSNAVLVIDLNAAGIAAILSNSEFRVGGRITTLSGEAEQTVFGNSGTVSQLEITTVPEPAAWLLVGCGLAAPLLMRRRRK